MRWGSLPLFLLASGYLKSMWHVLPSPSWHPQNGKTVCDWTSATQSQGQHEEEIGLVDLDLSTIYILKLLFFGVFEKGFIKKLGNRGWPKKKKSAVISLALPKLQQQKCFLRGSGVELPNWSFGGWRWDWELENKGFHREPSVWTSIWTHRLTQPLLPLSQAHVDILATCSLCSPRNPSSVKSKFNPGPRWRMCGRLWQKSSCSFSILWTCVIVRSELAWRKSVWGIGQ